MSQDINKKVSHGKESTGITIRKDGTEEVFVAGSTPVWHRVGQRTSGAVTSDGALKLAGLDWQVKGCPLYTSIEGIRYEVLDHKAIVRQDTKDVLGVVGKRYRPVQNAAAFGWLDELMGRRLAAYESAGSVRNGALVWALVRLPGEMRIHGADDVVRPYILVCNSHDGSVAFRALQTVIRVVCANSLTMAIRNAGPNAVVARHTRGFQNRLEDAQAVLGIAVQQHRQFEVQMNTLAQYRMTTKRFANYLDAVLGPPVENSPPENQAARLGITANFDHEFQRIKGIEHSAWAAVNAVSQYVDWERPSRGKSQVERDERRLSSTFVGQGSELKRKAWMAALTLIGAN